MSLAVPAEDKAAVFLVRLQQIRLRVLESANLKLRKQCSENVGFQKQESVEAIPPLSPIHKNYSQFEGFGEKTKISEQKDGQAAESALLESYWKVKLGAFERRQLDEVWERQSHFRNAVLKHVVLNLKRMGRLIWNAWNNGLSSRLAFSALLFCFLVYLRSNSTVSIIIMILVFGAILVELVSEVKMSLVARKKSDFVIDIKGCERQITDWLKQLETVVEMIEEECSRVRKQEPAKLTLASFQTQNGVITTAIVVSVNLASAQIEYFGAELGSSEALFVRKVNEILSLIPKMELQQVQQQRDLLVTKTSALNPLSKENHSNLSLRKHASFTTSRAPFGLQLPPIYLRLPTESNSIQEDINELESFHAEKQNIQKNVKLLTPEAQSPLTRRKSSRAESTAPTDPEHAAIITTFKSKLQRYRVYVKSQSGFEVVKSTPNYTIYTRKDPEFITKRCVMTLNFSIEEIESVLKDINKVSWHAKDVKKIDLLKRFDANSSVVYMSIKSPMFVADRDFVTYNHSMKVSENNILRMNFSAPNEKYPLVPKHVRATVDYVVWDLERTSNDSTKVDFLMRVNPQIAGLPL